MIFRWLKAIVALPGTVLVVIPALIGWGASRAGHPFEIAQPVTMQFWLGVTAALAGGFLAIWSTSMFFRFGKGTAAPWDPPQQFVVRGPYRHVRNPMILGVVLLLAAESLMFQSWILAGWAALFFVGNACYFPLVEEPGLERRFGENYVTYGRHVRRWLPRLNPWHPPCVGQDVPDERSRAKPSQSP